MVLRRQAFKYQLCPNGGQVRVMRQFAGSARFVFNKALALQQENYVAGNKFISYMSMTAFLPEWKSKPGFEWLKDSPSQTFQQVLKDVERAYKNFFAKRAECPKFKKKGKSTDSFRYPQGCKLDQINNRIFLPKLGWVRYRNSREVLGTVKNVTVSCKAGRWFISIQTEHEVSEPIHSSMSSVGIDLGVTRFATLSDGTFLEPVNALKTGQVKLSKLQRRLSRKKKFSKNWLKAKTKVTKLHVKIGNTRNDFLHKSSTMLSKNHAIIVIEDLKVNNMSKSAKGTVENPGKMVKQKTGLNRSILDQGWGEFRRQLEYKTHWAGGQLIAINPRNTSRMCSVCDHVSPENRKTQSVFDCVSCGYANNADLNAAINIIRAGLARLVCEVNGVLKPSATETHRNVLALTSFN